LFYPMAVMVLLTFLVGLVAATARFTSVRSGEVRFKYFKLMQGQEVPERVTVTTRCFNNMFEVPVLFYVACTLHIILGIGSLPGLVLAWLFVALRYGQALIHLTYNNFFHRMLTFWAAFMCALLLWANLVLQQVS
jgi:hypothetical protein